jgi:ligand-binding sensor domain-containing protein
VTAKPIQPKNFTEEHGLLYDGVLAINEDNANNLWILSQGDFYIKYSNK